MNLFHTNRSAKRGNPYDNVVAELTLDTAHYASQDRLLIKKDLK